MGKILKHIAMAPIYLILIAAAIVTYKWWGFDYFRHVIN